METTPAIPLAPCCPPSSGGGDAIVLLVILASLFGPGRVDGDTAAAIFVHFAGTTIVLLASLHLLRLGGCVMIRADARNKTATPDSRDESGPEERPGEPQIVAEPDPRTD